VIGKRLWEQTILWHVAKPKEKTTTRVTYQGMHHSQNVCLIVLYDLKLLCSLVTRLEIRRTNKKQEMSKLYMDQCKDAKI
jgi:hypothetical protein